MKKATIRRRSHRGHNRRVAAHPGNRERKYRQSAQCTGCRPIVFTGATVRGKAGRAVVVGGGFIGVEVAENLRARGLTVTIVEVAPHILAPFDTDMIGQAEASVKVRTASRLSRRMA